MDLKDLPVIIIDPSLSQEVNLIAGDIDGSPLFSVKGVVRTQEQPSILFKKYHVKAVIRFPVSYSRDLRGGAKVANIQVLIDGSDSNVGTIIRNAIIPLLTKSVLDQLNIKQPHVINVQPRILYNPQQRSALFVVPGLMAVILLMISALLTSLTITREKELGTMELLLVSPLKPFEIIFGKIFPYLAIAALDGVLIMLVGKVAFGIEITGSPILLAFASIIYIFTNLAIGLLISTVASTQQLAMIIVLPVILLPTIVLSGFIFPITSMPVFLQIITCIIPATYFLEIIRGIVLKGAGIAILIKPIIILSVIGICLIMVSIKRFRIKL